MLLGRGHEEPYLRSPVRKVDPIIANDRIEYRLKTYLAKANRGPIVTYSCRADAHDATRDDASATT